MNIWGAKIWGRRKAHRNETRLADLLIQEEAGDEKPERGTEILMDSRNWKAEHNNGRRSGERGPGKLSRLEKGSQRRVP